ncbi:regulatory helix-turn-helix protein, AraC family [Desulfotomaculum arcticum]|uniref:Regulatory helix-turn-helix protein, AraC family n=1 Tax=Desulfotruncus arcticus DSM 17038 TaxID=1121424 RepID=A0A1I2VX69_9FIRM|nr:AraC family transcriptional regulator [Desulfotruncus arcticus]SFG93730.1 regulatory helix-turn-helix protein, AraC family [Desulfotomaculum arcticum] [Desulfotruncus arcticus DSM 17038]
MDYIEMVNDAIQYIESNLHRKLSLEELAARYYISPTYFHRIFRAVANQTVKSYILGRKFSAAALALKKTDRNVADMTKFTPLQAESKRGFGRRAGYNRWSASRPLQGSWYICRIVKSGISSSERN